MKTFTDRTGREWTIDANVTSLRRVRSLVGVDLMQMVTPRGEDEAVIVKLLRDPCLLVDVIYAICKPDADRQRISDEAFGQAMAGDALDAATQALLEELPDFFPSRRDRERARRILAKIDGLIDQVNDQLDALTSDEAIDQRFQALISAGATSGSSPASPASTPAR